MMFGLGELLIIALVLLVPLAIIVGVIVLVVWLVRSNRLAGTTAPVTPKQDALEVLKLRYARGEITREQFEEMRRDLGV